MTSLAKRLAGKGIGHDMEYEEELVQNTSAVNHNSVVSIVSKVKDNVLQVITMLFMELQP